MEADDLAKDADAGPDDPPEFAEWLTILHASPRASDQWEDTCTRSQDAAHAGKSPVTCFY